MGLTVQLAVSVQCESPKPKIWIPVQNPRLTAVKLGKATKLL